MKGMLELKLIWIVGNSCLDLPSLTKIQSDYWDIHENMGRVILESMI